MSEEMDTLSNQYLTFILDNELYALEIATVQEVLEYMPITKVPRTPEFMRGVINVRGHAVPVIDLRRKFGLQEAEKTVDTCIIIVEVDLEGERTTMGALVDGVEEVLEIGRESIEPPPKLGTSINTRFIKGIGKLEDKFVIILNIKDVFSFEELREISTAGNSQLNELESEGEQG